MICDLCDEQLHEVEKADVQPLNAHWQCMLRETMGGIGHHIAHDYWCVQMHDPDAGLTHRQSALLVAAYYSIVRP